MRKKRSFRYVGSVHLCWLCMIILLTKYSHLQPDVEPLAPITTAQTKQDAHPPVDPDAPFDTRNVDKQSIKLAEQPADAPIDPKFQELIKDSKLHYIGVYESNANEYSTEEQRARYQQCRENTNNLTGQIEDCWDYAYRVQKSPDDRSVIVQINSHEPISLILTSYESVKWVLKGNTEQLRVVYLSGYEASEVSPEILPNNAKLYGSFYKSPNCSRCFPSPFPHFNEYKRDQVPYQTIESRFGHPLASIQGMYAAHKFYIN